MKQTIAIVGLGYVGLPLAVAFGKKCATIGLDLNEDKLTHYRAGRDPSGEVAKADLQAASQLTFTSEPADLSVADIVIVVVPTPIDDAHKPDLSPLRGACTSVGAHLKPGAIVIFESTVYPGCTEEVCVPILESASGMKWLGRQGADDSEGDDGFYIGYSPERINPGDKVHRLETIIKVVSGDTPKTLDTVAALYESVVDAGVHRAASVRVAEAAKVIENTQRDLNIALMNELSLIFNRIGIDTLDVLEAAGTKWNFLPFRPGLVGGHCIGVDPYYLTYKAEAEGHDAQVILAGRQINDGMGKFIGEQTVKRLAQLGKPVTGATVVILGLTFKEDCPDLRNSRVIDIIHELQEYRCNVVVHDPLAESVDAEREYGVSLTDWDNIPAADALVLAVPHAQYLNMTVSDYGKLLREDSVLIDVKSVLDRDELAAAAIDVWRL
ncbi:nucleotide sugar dehydrogenase [Halieaceae bacterium IMCC14734]|uniref:Nucleotide sugar dehydrogenase n=1 Tax=Candidatus Litorirhabdus singularis TaxID=2518993 RepID=A0ABT3TG45_9GAMM|nr:nucleotide sugar dehydrogenase [Candidatus Litorirhabdus singularis]MCX2981282.1 nucleotide sugar dehydrogenase [Candidatus Litorirhabdus singularis]